METSLVVVSTSFLIQWNMLFSFELQHFRFLNIQFLDLESKKTNNRFRLENDSNSNCLHSVGLKIV
jgi:hypothetical protein